MADAVHIHCTGKSSCHSKLATLSLQIIVFCLFMARKAPSTYINPWTGIGYSDHLRMPIPNLFIHSPAMENRKQINGRMSVPQFGGWNQKTSIPDYSMVFLRARADRTEQRKTRLSQMSLGKEQVHIKGQRYEDDDRFKNKKIKFLRFLNCCMSS